MGRHPQPHTGPRSWEPALGRGTGILARRGMATPEHILRCGRLPLHVVREGPTKLRVLAMTYAAGAPPQEKAAPTRGSDGDGLLDST